MDDELYAVADEVATTLRRFKSGAGEFAPGFDPYALSHEIRNISYDSAHLAEWVATVGDAFAEADSGAEIVTADDSWLSARVGEASFLRALRARAGQRAARELRASLTAAGIDPEDFHPDQLVQLDPDDPRYLDLFQMVDHVTQRMDDDAYAIAFFDQLNPDGIRATLGVIEMYAYHQRRRDHDDIPDLGNIRVELLDPFVNGFARASGSIDLAEERAALLGVDDSAGAWQQHQLALLISGDGHLYDPTFLASAADQILHSRTNLNLNDSSRQHRTDYPPLTTGPDLWDDPEMAFNELIALQALSTNPDAAFGYLQIGDAANRVERLENLFWPNTSRIRVASHSLWYDGPPEGSDIEGAAQRYSTTILDIALVDAVVADPDRYQVGLDTYADVVRLVGGRSVSDSGRQAAARAFVLYAPSIGEAAAPNGYGGSLRRAALRSRLQPPGPHRLHPRTWSRRNIIRIARPRAPHDGPPRHGTALPADA